MNCVQRRFVVWVIAGACLVWFSPLVVRGAEPNVITSQAKDGLLEIKLGPQVIAEYVWKDDQVARPYFRHLRTRSGKQVTRNNPPVKGQDIDDHPTMHPGLWLAFGDINGIDFWRNKGRVRLIELVSQTEGSTSRQTFAVQNSYEHDGKVIVTEACRIHFEPVDAGYVIHWQSTFQSGQSGLTFGDQEEMGLGVRVATPLAVVKGGEITDSEKRVNGAQVWGNQADWCQYGGTIDGRRIGIALMPSPQNFRRSWFHARDYGLVVANPFGRQAFTKGEPSAVVTPVGKEFTLRFDVLVYETPADEPVDVGQVYQSLVKRENR